VYPVSQLKALRLKHLLKIRIFLLLLVIKKRLKRFIIFIYLIKLGAISFGNVGIAVMEPSLPIWMMTTMKASEFQQGKIIYSLKIFT
jgi:hypothetical protein